MKAKVILSVVGSDRPGLTQAVADAVYRAGGNWLESHLGRLGGMYVGSVLVEMDADKRTVLEKHVREVDASGLHVSIMAAGKNPSPPGETILVEVVGQDRPGIVLELTRTVASTGANIEDFSSSADNSAWSGGLLFRAKARLTIPKGTSAGQVQSALESISGDIMVDFPEGQSEQRASNE
jgi:glycine cleavage system regulatory protein